MTTEVEFVVRQRGFLGGFIVELHQRVALRFPGGLIFRNFCFQHVSASLKQASQSVVAHVLGDLADEHGRRVMLRV